MYYVKSVLKAYAVEISLDVWHADDTMIVKEIELVISEIRATGKSRAGLSLAGKGVSLHGMGGEEYSAGLG